MDIPSIAEVHEMLNANNVTFAPIHCNICNEQLPPFQSNHSCAPYLKAAVDDLEMRLKAAEQKLHEMELKFWVMEGDGR